MAKGCRGNFSGKHSQANASQISMASFQLQLLSDAGDVCALGCTGHLEPTCLDHTKENDIHLNSASLGQGVASLCHPDKAYCRADFASSSNANELPGTILFSQVNHCPLSKCASTSGLLQSFARLQLMACRLYILHDQACQM